MLGRLNPKPRGPETHHVLVVRPLLEPSGPILNHAIRGMADTNPTAALLLDTRDPILNLVIRVMEDTKPTVAPLPEPLGPILNLAIPVTVGVPPKVGSDWDAIETGY